MKTSICIAVLVAMALLTTACGKQLSGTYSSIDNSDGVKRSLVFESGHKAVLTMDAGSLFKQSTEGTYEIDGNQFKFTMAGMTQVGEITTNKQGSRECINFGTLGLVCKSD
jgi:hypothetical protein